MQRGPLSTKWAQQRGGHAQEIFQKLPQTSPNFLKIVEKISFHQNNYFQSIKTYFKIFWSNAKRGAQSTLGSAKGGRQTGYPSLGKGRQQEIFQKSKNRLKLVQTF